MTDERLRHLERAFRASGTVADEAAWLVERERAGALPRATLERAAAMNHVPAQVALGLPSLPVSLPHPHGGLRGDALDPVPGDPCVRCWAANLEDSALYTPAPDLGAGGDVSLSTFAVRCPACAIEHPGLGKREERLDTGRVTYRRVLPTLDEVTRSAKLRDELRARVADRVEQFTARNARRAGGAQPTDAAAPEAAGSPTDPPVHTTLLARLRAFFSTSRARP